MQATVPMLSLIMMGFSLLISVGIPIGMTVYLILTKKSTIRPILTGVLVFFVFQVILRIPLLNAVVRMDFFAPILTNPWLYALILAFTAGLFEEGGRYLGYRTLAKDSRTWWDGVAYGIGHGGFEAMYLVGLTYINNIILSLAINTGTFEAVTANLAPATAQYLHAQLTSTNPWIFFAGGFERLMTMLIQTALSVLVLYGIRRGKLRYLFAALALHTLVDVPAVILPQVFGWNVWGVEGFIAACGILSGVYLILSKRSFARLEQPPAPSPVSEETPH